MNGPSLNFSIHFCEFLHIILTLFLDHCNENEDYIIGNCLLVLAYVGIEMCEMNIVVRAPIFTHMEEEFSKAVV